MKRILKKGLAFLITLSMAVTMILPGGAMTAWADDVPLPSGELQDTSGNSHTYSNKTSMWKWLGTGNVDIHGKTKKTDTVYDGVGQMKISYYNQGFYTVIANGEGGTKTNFGGNEDGSVAVTKVGDSTLETKMETSDSQDHRYVLVDYYVYNPSDTAVKDIWLGSYVDLLVGDHDGALMLQIPSGTPELVRGTDNGNDTEGRNCFTGVPYPYFRSTFDLIIGKNDALGTTAAESWLGLWPNQRDSVFETGNSYPNTGGDSAMAWHWHFDMQPHQIVHKRVAFYPQATAFYVNQASGADIPIVEANTGNNANKEIQGTPGIEGKPDGPDRGLPSVKGIYSQPFQNISHAVERIGRAPASERKGTINVQADAVIDTPIVIPSGLDITILSTDLDKDGNLVNTQKTLTRGAGLKGPIFKVDEGATLTLYNLTIDGAGVSANEPLIDASGEVSLEGNSLITNGDISGTDKPSAVYVHDKGKLTMSSVKISDNKSAAGGKGAVYLAKDESGKSGSITLSGKVTVSGNTAAGKPSNLVLGDGKKLTIYKSDDANTPSGFTGSVGVSTETEIKPKIPGGDPGIAAVITDNANGVNPSNYIGNFTSDRAEGNVTLTTKDNDLALEATALKLRVGCSLQPAQGAQIPPNFYTKDDQDIVAGNAVNVTAPVLSDELKAGKTLAGVHIDPENSGLSVDQHTFAVTGSMPTQATTITFLYTQAQGSIAFDSCGGAQLPTITGAIGSLVTGLFPSVSRYGYKANCEWYNNSDFTGQALTGLPDTFPENPLTLYAKWAVDNNVSFKFAVNHAFESGITEVPGTPPAQAEVHAEEEVQADPFRVPGYEYAGSVTPASSYYTATAPAKGEEQPVGTFEQNGHFKGRMPNADATVTYQYRVKPDQKFTLTVNHVSNGRTLRTDTHSYPAETSITIAPADDLYGYQYKANTPVKGFGSNPDQHQYGAVGAWGESASFPEGGACVFTGKMPNQDVEVTYNYDSTGIGYTYAVNYTQGGKAIPYADFESKTIPAAQALLADDPESYRDIYGYQLQGSPTADPHIDGNSFAPGTHKYTGLMPSQDLTLNYTYDRDAGKWGDVTFKAAANGQLALPAGHNADLSDAGGGSFKAKALLDDGSQAAQGPAGAYTWKKLEEQKLVPNYSAADTYMFDKWVVDVNDNGSYDPGTDKDVDPETLTFGTDGSNRHMLALFKPDPRYWAEIHFNVENGSIDQGQPEKATLLKARHWNELAEGTEKPAMDHIHGNTNYIWDGWYVDKTSGSPGTLVEDGDLIQNGVYTAVFKPDPDVFGQGLIAPVAVGTIDADGSAVVKVDDGKDGYRYVVADADGRIVGIKDGHDGTVSFPGMTPGTHYSVYEASAAFRAEIGSVLDASAVSERTDVLTPVVEDNYTVDSDAKKDDQAQIVISPADRKTDYALLDADGHVLRDWTAPGGSDPAVIFDGLDPGVDYIVVAKAHGTGGVTAASKYPDGNDIKADLLGDIGIPKYIVETLGGSVVQAGEKYPGEERYSDAKWNDTVKISADAANDAGDPFEYWALVVGDIQGMPAKVKHKDYTFTMPKGNVVLAAHYAAAASPSNATVAEKVRGGGSHEMAVAPDQLADLPDTLTTDADRHIQRVDHKKVTYKIVFDKGKATQEEKDYLKDQDPYLDHPAAFGTAWGLDVNLERYVDGRLIKPASPSDASQIASPSQATFKAYVQLEDKWADMADYQLYDVDKGGGAPSLITWEDDSNDPTRTGGLFSFQATTGHRYVLALSRAYRVYVTDMLRHDKDYLKDENTRMLNLNFRVRKGDALEDTAGMPIADEEGWPSAEQYETDVLKEGNDTEETFLGTDGVLHTYNCWSYRKKEGSRTPSEVDPAKQIMKRTHIYSWFDNDRIAVIQERKNLDAKLLLARELAKNYYLTKAQAETLMEEIRGVQEVYDRQKGRPFPNDQMEDGLRQSDLVELQAAIEGLRTATDTAQAAADQAQDRDQQISGGGGGGGGSAGSGKGSGTVRDPYVSAPDNSYRVGVNGSWEKLENGRWSFALNGGIPLQSMWAWLSYDADGQDKTGWYHFNSRGLMDDGWFMDESKNWYYCNTQKDGFQGMMKYGWYSDPADQHKYYLDPVTGAMRTGWQLIGGKWYYFTDHNAMPTYTYNPVTESWNYNGAAGKPYGSMWAGETTPDGYQLGTDGAWIE